MLTESTVKELIQQMERTREALQYERKEHHEDICIAYDHLKRVTWPLVFIVGCTGWISLQSKGLSRVFSNTTLQKHQFFYAQLSL